MPINEVSKFRNKYKENLAALTLLPNLILSLTLFALIYLGIMITQPLFLGILKAVIP